MSVETLRPNGVGDETNILYQYPSSGAHWDKVDEETPDDDSTYVYNNLDSYQRDLYAIADHSAGSGTINFIKVYARCRAPTSPTQASLKIAIKSGATASESSEITLTTSYADYSNQWNTNPATGLAWTWAEIDSIQAGISLRCSTVVGYSSRCTQLYIEVDYTADGVTEKTSSDTGSGADTSTLSASYAQSDTGSGVESLLDRDLVLAETGSGVDAYVSLETPEAKVSSDAGSGVEGTPLPSATLTGNETGFSIDALIARLLAAVDTGCGVEVGAVEVDGLLKNLFATELGLGSDSLTAKIEMPTKGGGMKLWT